MSMSVLAQTLPPRPVLTNYAVVVAVATNTGTVSAPSNEVTFTDTVATLQWSNSPAPHTVTIVGVGQRSGHHTMWSNSTTTNQYTWSRARFIVPPSILHLSGWSGLILLTNPTGKMFYRLAKDDFSTSGMIQTATSPSGPWQDWMTEFLVTNNNITLTNYNQ